jgi:hypothetical protein
MSNSPEVQASSRRHPIERLKMDLAAFADPGSIVEVANLTSDWVTATWQEDAQARTAEFSLSDSGPVFARTDRSEQTYASFLAGPQMGNLRALARNALHVISPLESFIPSTARLDGDVPRDGNALLLLTEAAKPEEDLTSVVFVAADAGVGKTILLKEAVRNEAERYLRGESTSLWLYVDAQARRLAALDEALAGELDRLRAKFSFDAALPLVRTGALTLVIDGFDELIGSVGAYDEAFNGLADFIGNLEGGGTLIAAARSAYYEQEFLARVSRGLGRGDRWVLKPLRLREWQMDQRALFVRQEASRLGILSGNIERIVERVESALGSGELAGVAGKPFFVDRTAGLVINDDLPESESVKGLLNRLVDAYIDRDASKLLTGARTPLLSSAGLRAFFDELAIEMWRQESRELSRSSVRELAALLGELEGLDDDGVREVATRAPYFAMLREGSMPGSVAWEHDVYFAFFLSRPLAEAISSFDAKRLGRLLRRGRLPEDAAAMVGNLTRHIEAQHFVDLMVDSTNVDGGDVDRVRRNAGLLAAGRLSDESHRGLRLKSLTIGDVALRNSEFDDCTFSAVEFAGTDLSSTRFMGCRTEGVVVFDRVLVSRSGTELDIKGLGLESFHGLSVRDDEEDRTLYSPADVRDVLNDCGLPSAAPVLAQRRVSSEMVNLIAMVSKLYSRTNVFVEADDDLDRLTSDPNWPALRRALIESGVVVTQFRSASGRKVFLERTVRADEIMAGLDPTAKVSRAVQTLWDLIEVS